MYFPELECIGERIEGHGFDACIAALRRVPIECDDERRVGSIKDRTRVRGGGGLQAAARKNECVVGAQVDGQRFDEFFDGCNSPYRDELTQGFEAEWIGAGRRTERDAKAER